jgi:predicted PurR-regulated permease PerM
MLSDRDYTRRMIQTVLTVAGVAILLAVLWAAREALMLVYVSALIAMGFSPLVKLIERARPDNGRRPVPRWLAILVIYAAIVAVVVLLGLMIIPPLVAQGESLWARMPTEFNRFQAFLVSHKVMTRPVTLEEAVQNAPTGAGGNAVGTVLVAISSLIGGVFGLITILILTFYLLIEAGSMFEYLVRFVPAGRRADVAVAAREAVVKVSAWLRAQFVLAGVMGTFSAVGLGLMGVPYFYVIALVAAIGETIPIVGPVIGGITAVGVAITVSPKLAVMVGAYFLVLHQLEANILVPKIMERSVGVSPVAVLIALLIGGALWGLAGAILAIPTVAILSVIVEELAVAQDAARLRRTRSL